MNRVPISENDSERLAVLKQYQILDTLPEGELDDLTRLASMICNTPIALISLLDENRQWFKSNIGLTEEETPRDISFCQYTVMGTDVLEISNACENEFFAQNPLVTGYPHIKFYAGAPLITESGHALGAICVMDTIPRQLDEKQKETLRLLSRLIMQQFELRRKKGEIKASKMLFHKIVEKAADIIYTADHKGDFTFMNQKVESMLGYTPAELLGKNFTDVIAPEWKKQVQEFYAEQFAKRVPETKLEFPVLTRWGDTRWVEQSVTAVIKDNYIQGFQGIVRDISARKKYETELLETKALLTHAMSIGRMGSFENNLTTQKISWSREIFEMMEMKFSDKALTYEEYLKTIHPEDLEEIFTRIQVSIDKKRSDVSVCRFVTGTGRVKWIETRIAPFFDTEGNLTSFRGTMQDITEQKELENLLITSKEMAEHSGMAKEQFLANMSHEIRTPMNAVLGFADLLAGTPLNEEQREYISAVQTSGKNLMAIINDILDYSKIEAGMMTIEESPLSIRSIFSSLAVLFSQKTKEKNLGLMFSSDPAIPETVLGDTTRLTQVITNLVSNAIKFTHSGSIKITATLAHHDEQKVEVKFAVKDTGIGIAADKIQSVFERFNQGSNSTTRKFGGTGLGLSIVKRLVELQGGNIWVTSKENEGSVFEFTIVFNNNKDCVYAEKATGAEGVKQPEPNAVKVLLVEDNAMNQKLAEKILHNMGYRVEIADNGKIAVDKVQENKYDLVLMDMQMPEMDGYEAATIIRKKLNNSIPIIAMTAHAMTGEKEKCLELGMNDYISKPFKPDNLREKIAALVIRQEKEKKKSLINLDVLKLIAGDDHQFTQKILMVFVEDTPVELDNLHRAIEREDHTVVRNISHKLISSIGLVGLKDRLLPVLHEMENISGNMLRIQELYQDLRQVCEKAFVEAKTHLQPVMPLA